jgi:hypothetical protein
MQQFATGQMSRRLRLNGPRRCQLPRSVFQFLQHRGLVRFHPAVSPAPAVRNLFSDSRFTTMALGVPSPSHSPLQFAEVCSQAPQNCVSSSPLFQSRSIDSNAEAALIGLVNRTALATTTCARTIHEMAPFRNGKHDGGAKQGLNLTIKQNDLKCLTLWN